MSRLSVPCLCLVTDRRLVAAGARTPAAALLAFERWLDEALDADVDLIQIRERDLEARALLDLAARLVSRRADRRPRILINDRADIALAAGADGVHLRSDGPPVVSVRSLGGAGFIIGRSIHSDREAREHDAADYLLFGTVFPGGSKGSDRGQTPPAQGTEALARTALASRAPVLAIGGVTPDRVPSVREAGAAGVAAIGVFLPEGRLPGALGPVRAAAALRAALTQAETPNF
ncbi:MAG: thiamine phosphate synthase [Vicinamibacterales bacterium]